jgi:hypothetical protein
MERARITLAEAEGEESVDNERRTRTAIPLFHRRTTASPRCAHARALVEDIYCPGPCCPHRPEEVKNGVCVRQNDGNNPRHTADNILAGFATRRP